MAIFFAPHFSPTHLVLPPDEQAHLRVLRLRVGEVIEVCDGVGNLYEARLEALPKSHAPSLSLLSHRYLSPAAYHIHICIAPTKNIDRIEWFVEKATEIGIQEISFVLCEHSERKELRLERLERVAVSALKQSRQTHLPKLNPLLPLQHWLQSPPDAQCFVAHLAPDASSLWTAAQPEQTRRFCVLVGPEGDFSPAEIAASRAAGFEMVCLGNSRLRTETAGLYALNALHLKMQA